MTAAGISGGIDMALSLVGKLRGERSERWVQLLIEYDPGVWRRWRHTVG
jgi:transcriptional regulator GlxA family with amidase domain